MYKIQHDKQRLFHISKRAILNYSFNQEEERKVPLLCLSQSDPCNFHPSMEQDFSLKRAIFWICTALQQRSNHYQIKATSYAILHKNPPLSRIGLPPHLGRIFACWFELSKLKRRRRRLRRWCASCPIDRNVIIYSEPNAKRICNVLLFAAGFQSVAFGVGSRFSNPKINSW